jgi:flavin reductase (DIM6/NTAB) family NADH-FMN oxidoreductase RutF
VNDAPVDPQAEFRLALGHFATGVTVITVVTDDDPHGMTANAFMSVSLDPPLVVVSVDKKARMHSMLRKGLMFGVSVLHESQQTTSDYFARRAGYDQTFTPEFSHVLETPLVAGAVAHLVAEVVEAYWGGDHTLFLGEVHYTRWEDSSPLLFYGGQYQRLFQ